MFWLYCLVVISMGPIPTLSSNDCQPQNFGRVAITSHNSLVTVTISDYGLVKVSMSLVSLLNKELP